MASSLDAKINEICDEMAALKNHTDALDRRTNLYAMEDICELLLSGEGLLKAIREPMGVTATAPAEDPGTDEEEEATAQATNKNKNRVKEVDDDPDRKGKLGEERALSFLEGLEPEINTRLNMTAAVPPSSLRSDVTPFSHQLRAAALGVHSESTPFQGQILADPPGLGKTLATLMATESARQLGDGPVLIVAPPSCTRQWVQEIRNNLAEGATRVLLLNDSNVSPFDLFRYKIIVTSYGHVVSEYRRLAKFEKGMELYEQGKNIVVPKRPKLTLLSGIWEMDGVRMLGRHLVLDEVHAIKNTSTQTYAAIKMLRKRFTCCLMLSGTPLDNTWEDIYSLLSMLRGHPFVSMLRMREIFTDAYNPGQKKQPQACVPRLYWLHRLVRLLHAVTIARPQATIARTLPPFFKQVVSFSLPKDELVISNEQFQEYKKTIGANREETGDSLVKWSALIAAQQWAFHPELVEIMELERKTMKHNMNNEGVDDVELTADEQLIYAQWGAHLKEGEASRSARVDCILDIINRHRDCRPDDGILILDESVFFLDILEAALKHVMYDPVPAFRYDGRQNPAERHLTMQAFWQITTGTRVMLATRGTGGQGLNVQCASVVIRCGPWWKQSWELQADNRVYRPGQTKPVWVYEILARKCQVETYKKKVHKKKNLTNQSIMGLVTLEDGQSPPPWDGK